MGKARKGKKKLVKENAAASNEPINFRARMIVAIFQKCYQLSPLIITGIF